MGRVENTTDSVLTRVGVEVHLDNGAELGPTTPTDLGLGDVIEITLSSTSESFNAWTTCAEVGSSKGGSEHGSAEKLAREAIARARKPPCPVR